VYVTSSQPSGPFPSPAPAPAPAPIIVNAPDDISLKVLPEVAMMIGKQHDAMKMIASEMR
jgi:hypothetical protein